MPPAKKKTAEGPKYSELIKAALLGLKERNGSSLAAIKKYMASNFPAAKARPTRYRAACRITYLHPVPGFPRIPLLLAPPSSSYLPPNLPPSPRVSPSLPLPQTNHAEAAHAARACLHPQNDLALKNALKFGVSKGMFIKVKASFKLSPEAKVRSRPRGSRPRGSRPRSPPRPKAARSRSGARGGGCRGANAAPVYDSPTALLRPVRRTALSRSQLLARSDGVPPEPVQCARTLG